ncbi:hypothetical protein RVR_9260 [Actinacidiphila reveromycinica]|uniref:Uncharacterized protein n=1 Tax=Actinacidiphila reveromycinica TaxID=659352 RepID=A0A7U3V012_9ACTN|nr:DUF6643 family protein [Streptomyces sp. SN-593]BBB01719.1 hypothetical protein RVR_9260 [Streptomyces sp. SN-593]
MTTPRGSYGGGSGSYYPSSASFPDTPIYDSLVAERGTPQIAPIRVPAPYPSYESGGYNSFGGGGNLPALPAALPALPAGPSAPVQQMGQQHQPQYQPAQNGYQGGGYPQQPASYAPQQAGMPRQPQTNGYGGYPAQPQQPSPSGYQTARPAPPRPMAPRQGPAGHPEDTYQRRNLGLGVPPAQPGGGYYQG